MSLMRRIQTKIEQGKTNEVIARELRSEGDIQELSVSLENYIQRVRVHLARRPSCAICGNALTRMTRRYIVRTSRGHAHTSCVANNPQDWRRCRICGTYVRRNELEQTENYGNVCSNCFRTRFSRCGECNEQHMSEDLITLRRNGREVLFCHRCCQEANPVKAYSYSPRQWNFGKMPWENTTYLGIELEIDPKNDVNPEMNAHELIELLKELRVNDKFYLKEDASIRGYEIVTHPLTLAYIKENINFKKIIEFLNRDMISYDSSRCGMHVHVSKDDLDDKAIKKMRLFFMYASDSLKVLSNRKSMGYHYCQFERKIEELTLAKANNLNSQCGRYWALNLNSSKRTLEVRIFRGTLNYERFMANLSLVDAIVSFCKKMSLTNFINNHENIFKLFVEYIKNTQKYNELYEFIKTNHSSLIN